MHPLLASRGRLALYLLVWAPLGGLLGFLFSVSGGLPWGQTTALMVPLALVYAFVCLSPLYLCQMLPLGPASLEKALLNHTAAAVVASLLWIVIAKGIVLGVARWYPALNEHFGRILPLLFGIGVLLYILAVALHYVLLSMQSSREAEVRAQEARVLAREAEIKALKAQINPHFLFNSLHSISALTTVDGLRAREMCLRLSDFLRNTLSLGARETILLSEELALAKTYLDVEQVRFGNRLRVQQEIDPSCTGCSVPSLILQPLVENAVKHGIAGLVEGGSIRLFAECAKGILRVRVENEFDADAPSTRKNGIGLANVRNRLQARYPEGARLNTESKNEHYVAEVILPCDASHQEN